MGEAENDIRRCKSGIIYSLNQLANDGHVYATREQLIKDANERLGLAEIASNSQTTVPNTSASSPITEEIPLGMVAEPTPQMRPPVEQALEELISAEELKVEDECIYLPPFYYSEVGVAKKLLELRNAKQDNLFAGQVNMESIEKESGITYDDVQQAAIHKSQGSEYPIVVIPVFYSFFTLLQRNLIYTAITRAKKICVLIGQMKALGYAVKNLTVEQRNTKLKERLRTNE